MGFLDDLFSNTQVQTATNDAAASTLKSASDWFGARVFGFPAQNSTSAVSSTVSAVPSTGANKISSFISAHLFLIAAMCAGGVAILVLTGRRGGKKK